MTPGLHFQWYDHREIFDKSSVCLFELFKLSLTHLFQMHPLGALGKNALTSEKTDVSSVKSLRLESNPLVKSFMCTKKNNRPKIDP